MAINQHGNQQDSKVQVGLEQIQPLLQLLLQLHSLLMLVDVPLLPLVVVIDAAAADGRQHSWRHSTLI